MFGFQGNRTLNASVLSALWEQSGDCIAGAESVNGEVRDDVQDLGLRRRSHRLGEQLMDFGWVGPGWAH